jgi:diadenosine tetraphosphatase ApaH/serine/threonine PP2A family protein phosphatase
MTRMRVIVISDIHANLTALEAVLADAATWDAVWCLGDLVGYGPDPNDCVERVRALPNLLCLIGNHDQAALGNLPLMRFTRDARDIAAWTSQVLTADNQAWLASLPTKITVDPFTLAHGSPRQPIWEYILDQHVADRNFEFFETEYCLVGHSHLPLMFHRQSGEDHAVPVPLRWGEANPLTPRRIINPGSVGQPRDMDPRSAYGILDLEAMTWEPRRVAYDIAQVQLRILRAGLPERQALRLIAGW